MFFSVRLVLCQAGVYEPAYCLVPLEQHNSTTFVSGCKIIPCLVEFDGGDDISYKEEMC